MEQQVRGLIMSHHDCSEIGREEILNRLKISISTGINIVFLAKAGNKFLMCAVSFTKTEL